jgi:hypothetical protein
MICAVCNGALKHRRNELKGTSSGKDRFGHHRTWRSLWTSVTEKCWICLKFWHSLLPPWSLLSKQTGLPTILEADDLAVKSKRSRGSLKLVLGFVTVIDIMWRHYPRAAQITVFQVDHDFDLGNPGNTILRAQFDVIMNAGE